MSRNRFHSLCPYFAMFPETFVEKWLNQLSKRGDLTLDPFSGRGTTPFQSLLMERQAVACDVNDVAYCVTRAKTNAPAKSSLKSRLSVLEKSFSPEAYRCERERLPTFFRYAYHPWTLSQVLHLRRNLLWQAGDVDCMLAAMLLGIFHGESEKSNVYLSCQMPRTISTKPDYSIRYWKSHLLSPPIRNVFDGLRRQIDFRYVSQAPAQRGEVFHADMRDLPRLISSHCGKIKHVITSPPYFDVTNFEEDQWLRLWFLGGPPNPTRNRISRDDRHSSENKYWSFIGDMWRMFSVVLARNANIIVRIGATAIDPDRIAYMLHGSAVFARRAVELIALDVSPIKGRQTDSFRPGSKGCLVEVDCHMRMA